MTSSIALDLFDAYAANLTEIGRSVAPVHMLCPLDLSRIERIEVEQGKIALEHIVPQHATSKSAQKTPFTQLGVKNVRSGLTLTCTACNTKKGQVLDWAMRDLIGPGVKLKADYTPRAGVAILVYAYLFAFAVFGYEYILRPELDEVRRQFEDPDGQHTDLLNYAEVNLGMLADDQPVVANQWGYPFVIGGSPEGPLHILFWRFRAMLPKRAATSHPIAIPESVRSLVSVDPQ